MIPITQPIKGQVHSKPVDQLFSTTLIQPSTDQRRPTTFSHILWRRLQAECRMADFVENEPKCVMIKFPHHPPRLAQLCGVFVVCSTTASPLVRMSQWGARWYWLMQLVLLIDAFMIFKIRALLLQNMFRSNLKIQNKCYYRSQR